MGSATVPSRGRTTAASGLGGGSMTEGSAGSGTVAGVVSGRPRGVRLAGPADGRGAATARVRSRGRDGAEQGFVPGLRGGGAPAATSGTLDRDGTPDPSPDSHDTFPR